MEKKTSLKFLDCSLRDGGYYTNWDFERSLVEEYLSRMNKLPVDYIEVGYRSMPKKGYLGAYFYCPDFILDHAAGVSQKKLAIILNEKDIQSSQLSKLLRPCQGTISLVRIAIAPQKLNSVHEIVQKIKNMGFEVSLNVMYLSAWDKNPSFLEKLSSLNGILDYFYLVDSYGGMYPEEVRAKMALVRSKISVPLGFHAHNNMELALANTLAAIGSGVNIVDSTIMGMGRGAGNLKTEFLLTSLHSQGKLDVDYDELSQVVSLFSTLHSKYQWGTNLAYMVSGANSLPQQQVMDQISKRYYSLNSIVRTVHNVSMGIKDNVRLKEFNPKEKYKAALIVGGGPSATIQAEAITKFLDSNPGTSIVHVSSKNAEAYQEVRQQQYHCLIGNEGHRLEKVYENLEHSDKIAVLPPFPRTMGTYVPPSIKERAFQLSKSNFPQTENESVTAIAVETALRLKAEILYFVGYDGYEGGISEAEMELFQENEALFGLMRKRGVTFCSLTSTKYTNLKQESVFSYL